MSRSVASARRQRGRDRRPHVVALLSVVGVVAGEQGEQVSYGAGSGATASASAVWSANRSRCSSARSTEARVPARVASWVMSFGTGV
ncbi:hypothetical protein SFUMM280S_02722 [Streptomyces fumanus]